MSHDSVQTDPDRELAARFREGDSEAYRRLHDAHAPLVLAFLQARTRPPLSAEDASQETWLRVWRFRQKFQDGHFRGWLFQIARNVLSSSMSAAPKNSINSPEVLETFAEPARYNISDQEHPALDALRDCLGRLEGPFIEVVRDDYHGLTTTQIAAKQNIAEATVYTRLKRGRDQLKECIERKLK